MKACSESGRTLVEMVAAISIMGVIAAGAMSGVSYGLQSYRAGWAYETVEQVANDVIDLYSWDRAYPTGEGSMKTRICGNDIFEETCDAGSTDAQISTPWGGKLTVSPNSANNFNITITNVPEGICNHLVGMKWNLAIPEDTISCSSGTKNITFTVE